MMTRMRVTQLWRYPVKSLAGERLERAEVGSLGITGDRQFGLLDVATGLVLTARRVPELLFAAPVTGPDGGVAIRLPDGRVTADDTELSDWLGRRITLRAAAVGPATFEYSLDDEPGTEWISWESPAGVFHDSGKARVSITTETALGGWDVRRFRPNIVVDTGDERDLVGHQVRVGDALLDVTKELARCTMVTRPQPGIERDVDVLRTVNATRSGNLAVGALILTEGTLAVGDELQIVA